MFSFAGAKVRQFYATNQIYEQESTKSFLFIDIYQNIDLNQNRAHFMEEKQGQKPLWAV